MTLLPVTLTSADRFARITVALRAKGRPIAMETGAELVSADEHFEAINGLAWFRPSARDG